MLFLLLLAAAQTPYPIHSVQVEGNSALPAEAIVRASGLALGQNATPADFEAASARLSETGLFESVGFRYKAAPGAQPPGFDVVFQVTEAAQRHPARLEIPGFDEARLWEGLQQRDPLLRREIPSNDRAVAYYILAIEQYLAGQGRPDRIVAKRQLGPSADMLTVFRPAVLARIVQVRVEGLHAISAEAFNQSLVGSDYTEQRLRELLENNVRPLYEEQGRLRVAFPRIRAEQQGDGVAVAIAVDEGPVYTLGRVEVACQGVPSAELLKAAALEPGQVANWKKVALAAANIETALARYGFLESSSQIERTLDDANRRVDVLVAVQKGRQSVFGELMLQGLPPEAAARARKLWKLPAGAPMNVPYVDEYLRTVAADPPLRRHVRSIGRRVQPRPDSNVVDVTVTFE